MKRLVMAVVVTGIAAAAFAAWGLAAPAGSTTAKGPATADKTRLPALPAEVRQRKRWIVGVKCDAPPFGYINVRGQNAGFDVEIARWFSRYAFGRDNRVTFECAPTPAREPLLTTGRVDLVISTFTYTTDRDTRIDFSRAYYRASGRLLVKNDSSIQRLSDISGKRVATTSGSIYDRWVRRCFPNTQLTVTDSFTNALLAFNQGRADTLMWDDSVLVGIATADRSSKLTNDVVPRGPVRDRDPAGERGDEALGRREARADAEAGPVHVDPAQQRPGPPHPGVLAQHPAPEQQVRVPAARDSQPGHRVPVAGSATAPRPGGRPRASRPSPCFAP